MKHVFAFIVHGLIGFFMALAMGLIIHWAYPLYDIYRVVGTAIGTGFANGLFFGVILKNG